VRRLLKRLCLARRNPLALVLLAACSVLQTSLVQAASQSGPGTPGMILEEHDVLALLEPSSAAAHNGWAGVECFGINSDWDRLPGQAIHGVPDGNGMTLRFGITKDPLGVDRDVLMFRVSSDDPLTNGANRCEIATWNKKTLRLPSRQDLWFSFSVLVDFPATLDDDDQLIAQWHVFGLTGFSPFFAVYVSGGADRIEIRHNASREGTPLDTARDVIWRNSEQLRREWITYIVNARISPDVLDRPFLRVWRNGRMIVDVRKPFGYASPNNAFAKVGFYHWTNARNVWRGNAVPRSVYIRRALIVRGEGRSYGETLLRAATER
jgi:hypothetical protein